MGHVKGNIRVVSQPGVYKFAEVIRKTGLLEISKDDVRTNQNYVFNPTETGYCILALKARYRIEDAS